MIHIALFALVTAVGSAQAPSPVNQEDAQKLTPLIRASARGDLAAVSKLLAAGADPNIASSEQAITPLMSAAYFGHLDVVKALVAKGAKVDRKDFNGGGAIDWAVVGDRKEVDQWLESKGAVLNPFLNLFSFPVSFMERAAGKTP